MLLSFEFHTRQLPVDGDQPTAHFATVWRPIRDASLLLFRQETLVLRGSNQTGYDARWRQGERHDEVLLLTIAFN